MTTLVTADWHLNDNRRDRYRHDFQKTLRKVIKDHAVDKLIMLGDLTDEKDRHGAVLVNAIVDHLSKLSELCRVTILRGNHDYVSVDHPFYAFVNRMGITWINNPTVRGDALFLPHTTNWQRDWKDVPLTGRSFIYAHNTFEGANVGHRKLSGIPLDVFPKDAVVLSGDVHVPQKLGVVHYVGAPYTIDFGDNYKPRMLLASNDDTFTDIPCPGPQKRLIEVTSLEDFERVKVNAGDILKVRVIMSSEWMKAWKEIIDYAHEWADNHGCKIYAFNAYVTNDRSTLKKEKRLSAARMSRSDDDVLRDYGKWRSIGERLLKTGQKLMRLR